VGAAIFYILAATILIFSFMSVTSRRILRSAIYLLFVLAATAGIYFMLNYFFLAAVQIIVYIGGIVVLIIFSVLLTSRISELLEPPRLMRIVPSALVSLAGATLVVTTLLEYNFKTVESADVEVPMAEIGSKMLNYEEGGYVLPFEVISILLLAAMIAAIVIAKREQSELTPASKQTNTG